MRTSLHLVSLLLSVSLAAAQGPRGGLHPHQGGSLDELFSRWMEEHHKHYTSDEELEARKQIFAETMVRNEKLRKVEPEATFGLNKFADLTPEEFKAMYMGYKPIKGSSEGVPVARRLGLEEVEATSSWDWRKEKPFPVSPVKNQGQCGSCWAFSTTEGIESARVMQGASMDILSPQEIVSCDHVDMGCGGGDLPTAFKFVESLSTPTDVGLTKASDYPYTSGTTGITGACKTKKEKHGFVPVQKAAYAITPCSTISDAGCSNQYEEEPQLAAQLLKRGPISICVDASPWQTYTGGILKNPASCPGGQFDLDHCVQLVGFDTSEDAATPYWTVRNSWATDWGEEGFIRLKYGVNMCGVADEPMFSTDSISEVADIIATETVEFVGVVSGDAASHYEDPNTTGSCQTGEIAVQIQGVEGKMCAPKCAFITKKCPTDVPAGVTAKPTCALQGMGGHYCALICSPSTDERSLRAGDAQCGANASCKAISGTGICTYDK